VINSGKHSVFPEIVFSKCNTKSRNEKYILSNSLFLTEIFYILYRKFTGFPMIKLCCWKGSAFIRIEINTSTSFFKNRFIIVLCIFIGIACQCIFVIKGKIIGGIFFCFQLFSTVSPVNIINDNTKRGTVSNNMMNVKEQVITITGSVKFKSEKLFIKQHIWANQSFFVHSVYDLCFIA